MTFFGRKSEISANLCVQIRIETKTLSKTYLDPDHQALIDNILGLKENGLNCRQIAEKLNDEGVTSWNGKRFYSELVFGVVRKARLKKERLAHAVVEVRTTLQKAFTHKTVHPSTRSTRVQFGGRKLLAAVVSSIGEKTVEVPQASSVLYDGGPL